MQNKNLLILGAGQYGVMAKEIAEAMGAFDRIAFLDDAFLTVIPAKAGISFLALWQTSRNLPPIIAMVLLPLAIRHCVVSLPNSFCKTT